MVIRGILAMVAVAAVLPAQDAVQACASPIIRPLLSRTGTRIPLSMVNSVSTKTSGEGDRVYLETSFPIAVNGKIVIPAGSYVLGTVTASKRPGKVKGRGEFRLRFDSLMLPNGVTRDFRAQVAGLDGRATEDLDKKEGIIRSEGNKSGDARVIGETATTGAAVGGLAGIGRAPGLGAGYRSCRGSHRRTDRRSGHARSGRRAGQGHYRRDGAGSPADLRRRRAEFHAICRRAIRPATVADRCPAARPKVESRRFP